MSFVLSHVCPDALPISIPTCLPTYDSSFSIPHVSSPLIFVSISISILIEYVHISPLESISVPLLIASLIVNVHTMLTCGKIEHLKP